MNNLSSDLLKKYLNSLKSEYSNSSFKRKLSSLRRFIEFLKSRRSIDNNLARKLQHKLKITPKQLAVISNDSQQEKIKRTVSRPQEKQQVYSKLEKDPTSSLTKTAPSSFTSKQHLYYLLSFFLFFSLNIFLVGKLQSKISKDILTLSYKNTPLNLENSNVLGQEDFALTIALSGSLSDNYNIPLSFEQEISFSIYPSANSTSALYSTGRCSISPDDDGKFNIVIGADCGRLIPYSLYAKNPELYLATTIGLGGELLPRIPLKKIEVAIKTPTPTPKPTLTPTPQFIDDSLSTNSGQLLNNIDL